MKILKIHPTSVDDRYISEAVAALRSGEIIIYPTDTLYALGCDALNNRAVERLCRIKGINPDKNLLSVVCDGLSQASFYARIDNRAFALLKKYLPGPFTFVLPASTNLPKIFKGRHQVGIRIPDNAIARRLAEELGNPLMSSSAVMEADDLDAVDAEAVAACYGKNKDISMTIDGGPSGTQPSTVVDCVDSSDCSVLRYGAGLFE